MSNELMQLMQYPLPNVGNEELKKDAGELSKRYINIHLH